MTDEQKFRLLEWMKAITISICSRSFLSQGEIEGIANDLHRFEKSLQSQEKTHEH